MVSILMLGGTGFVGRHITEAALAAGHDVTVFNRGKTNEGLFPGAARLIGDRYAGEIDALRTGEWDVVIDVNGYHTDHLLPVLDALDGRVGHYTFISTVSVYRSGNEPIDERSPLDTDVHDTSEDPHANYGSDKVRCEQAVQARFGQQALIIRPGIVAGPHDPTERFTHWVRAAAADAGPIRATRPDQPVQVIHARDQADFVVAASAAGVTGSFNTTGPTQPVTMAEMIAACAEAAGTAPEMIWLSEHEVAEDEVSVPLYLPSSANADGLFMASCARAVAAGLVNRPLVETAADTLAWARSVG